MRVRVRWIRSEKEVLVEGVAKVSKVESDVLEGVVEMHQFHG